MRDNNIVIVLLFVFIAFLAVVLVAKFPNVQSVEFPDEAVRESIVLVTYEWEGWNHEGEFESGVSTGSGVVVDTRDSFEILTARHVIDCAFMNGCGSKHRESVKVMFADGSVVNVSRVAVAPSAFDIALLELSSDAVARSITVPAVSVTASKAFLAGFPADADNRPHFMITSGQITDRQTLVQDGLLMDTIQTDADSKPGNSGGGLFNEQGQLLGVVAWNGEGKSVAIAYPNIPPLQSFHSCESGWIFGEKDCAQYCDVGDVLTAKKTCVAPCDGFYCNSAIPTIVVDGCESGMVKDSMGLCKPACGGNVYCNDASAICYDDTCTTCPEGHVLFED